MAHTPKGGGPRLAESPLVLRQNGFDVKEHIRVLGGTRRDRQVGPEGLQPPVVFAPLQQYPNYGQTTMFVLMHQVQLHQVLFAIDGVLAGPVEVELEQPVLGSVHGHRAAVTLIPHAIASLDGVTIVENVKLGRLVVEIDVPQRGWNGVGNVDGGLSRPIDTGGKFGG